MSGLSTSGSPATTNGGTGADTPQRAPAPRRVEHPSVAERAAHGKAERRRIGRSVHGAWTPPAGRQDPVTLLEAQAATRVTELVPIRYGRMLTSPFSFFRGAAAIMAADLAGAPRTDLRVQLCGDAHLLNFGAFAAPDRRMVFSINDFDETLPGPFEWDVKRLVASFAVAARQRGFDAKQRRAINRTVSRAYREAMAGFAAMGTMELWYTRMDVDEIMVRWGALTAAAARRRFESNVAKAQAKDSLRAFGKLTQLVDGEPRIKSQPPLLVPIQDAVRPTQNPHAVDFIHEALRAYRRTLPSDRRILLERFRYAHSARKVVGVGSVGTRAWIVLLLGRDNEDPLFLQAKEAEASVLEPALGRSAWANHGQRVVEGQRLTQAASDILLGWVRLTDDLGVERDFYVRQLWDAKGSALVEAMEPSSMRIYAELCGWTLARGHARSGDAVALASYLGRSETFDRALADFAEAYADQNERDHEALVAAAASGRIAVQHGV